MAEIELSIRIDLETGERIGPGRIALLEAIGKTGSITAAAASMQMSYYRAWRHVDELNRILAKPVIASSRGGGSGGSTTLTPVGERIIALYHSVQEHTRSAGRTEFQSFRKLIRS
jgi:molybdate transport system regulatory protein